jgi:hypothetical protein
MQNTSSVVWKWLSNGIIIEVIGSYGGEYEDDSLLGHWTLMMEAVRTYETSVDFYETKQHNIPEGCRLRNTVRQHV